MKLSKQAKKFLTIYDDVQRTITGPISITSFSKMTNIGYQTVRRHYINLVKSGHIKNKAIRFEKSFMRRQNDFFKTANEKSQIQLKVADTELIKQMNKFANEIEALALILLGKDLGGIRVLEVARDLYEISKEMRK